ncbi:CHAP domain-containing protein [Arthrobacter sp. OY3WO11]|uniref:CHAP domain-containing protein n=1 Tax=Arthrobacter sp. OY3WO11 TaxID=1835723 RepID=UPI0007D03B87|nr:CHAP domain-containing protein [Arthrobacter sp. OY3WO11]OAE01849.1 hypothetical protein A6A22_10805 [Arthrobacter sp. OY3WO11]
MNLDAFIAKYTGVPKVGNTPENTGECVGLSMVWTASQKLPHTWGHAKDLLANADRKAFDVIANSPTNYPQPGDVLCMDRRWGGGYGHTGVVVRADVNTYTLFEQNNPKGSAPRVVAHPNYYGVQGWMRSKNKQGDEEVIRDADNEYGRWNKLFVQIRGRNASREEFRQAAVGRTWLQAMEILSDDQEADAATDFQIWGRTAKTDRWDLQISSLQQKVSDLTTQNQGQQKTIDGLTKQIETLQNAPKPAETTPVVQPPTSTTPATPASPAAPNAVKAATEKFFAGENGKIALQVGGAVLFYVLDNAADFGVPSGLAAAIGLALGHTVANRTAKKLNK